MFVKNSVLNFRNFSEAIIVETTIKLGNKELSGRPKIVPYPYIGKWQIGHGKWFLNTNKFLIKPFLISKFDCI